MELDWTCPLCYQHKLAYRSVCAYVHTPGGPKCTGARPPRDSPFTVQGGPGDVICGKCTTTVWGSKLG
eukprot:14945771-Heterocapsa_arctica.AAC.1